VGTRSRTRRPLKKASTRAAKNVARGLISWFKRGLRRLVHQVVFRL
jgi:hypothetical protein